MATDASYRLLPSVDRVLGHPQLQELLSRYQRQAVVDLVRQRLEAARQQIAAGEATPGVEEVVAAVTDEARALWRPGPRPVINATGVILHTNLGRAPLSPEAREAALQAARGYSALELGLEEGERSSRQEHVRHLLCRLTGAKDALVVNNNASAVLLVLAALASGSEVIVSRGEAVEIGGGFRIPDVLRQSGATLVEVGATNRTYLSDYDEAITERTAALLHVHTSNFRVVGFTHAPPLPELAELARRRQVLLLHDLGSGCLLETAQFGLAHEPTPQESIAAGCHLACFSADKLLGGPQAGIILGRSDLVQRLARHPLARAMRIDKLNLAALAATLLHYLQDEAVEKVPVWRMIAVAPQELERRACGWAESMGPRATVPPGLSAIGGGSLPGETLPTWTLALKAEGLPGGADGLARRLRQGDPPVIARIEGERVLLDPRTVLPEEDASLRHGVQVALAASG